VTPIGCLELGPARDVPGQEKAHMPFEPLAGSVVDGAHRRLNHSAPLRTMLGTLAIDSTLLMTGRRRVETGDRRERRAGVSV
jgi:hypothetical protein